jgi:hypothetical protein
MLAAGHRLFHFISQKSVYVFNLKGGKLDSRFVQLIMKGNEDPSVPLDLPGQVLAGIPSFCNSGPRPEARRGDGSGGIFMGIIATLVIKSVASTVGELMKALRFHIDGGGVPSCK